ncbi:MAG: ABC transporter [Pseudonocardia sp. SCN 73-27]|nr:MAG: ABC transporter [Pseudonocardia sp. SCN 72-51]ODV08883.1 MAG: ABC transporter [Pseudonocardia sp. SCN 73-27]
MLDQVVHATRELWRTRVVFVFTFLFPLTWLIVIGFLAGNATVDGAGGVRVMQFVTPTAIAMGVLYAAFPTVAISLSTARDQKVLKRVHGTPLPAWIYFAGRIGSAVAFAVGSVLTMLLVGIVAYDVQIVWRTALATLVTLVVGVACFAALGLAVAAVASSAAVAQAASIAGAVVLGFLSGLFTVGELPGWASATASVFPLKPFTDALRHQFTPFHPGSGWDLGALGVLFAWGLAGVVIATLAFRWEPARRKTRRAAPAAPVLPVARPSARSIRASAPGRPGAAALLLAQVRWALLRTWRDPGSVFFTVVMPVAIFAFTLTITGGADTGATGVPFGLFLAAGMTTWGTAVASFVNVPGTVAVARDRGVLKRLRGTPLPLRLHLAGQTASALIVALLTGVLVLGVGTVFLDVPVSFTGVPLAITLLVLGTTTLAACGFALAGTLPSSKAVTAVGLGILLPLSFFSDVFPTGHTPAWMSTVGAFLPLKHLANGLADALAPGGPTVNWVGVGVLVAWLVAAALLAARTFRMDGDTT